MGLVISVILEFCGQNDTHPVGPRPYNTNTNRITNSIIKRRRASNSDCYIVDAVGCYCHCVNMLVSLISHLLGSLLIGDLLTRQKNESALLPILTLCVSRFHKSSSPQDIRHQTSRDVRQFPLPLVQGLKRSKAQARPQKRIESSPNSSATDVTFTCTT